MKPSDTSGHFWTEIAYSPPPSSDNFILWMHVHQIDKVPYFWSDDSQINNSVKIAQVHLS